MQPAVDESLTDPGLMPLETPWHNPIVYDGSLPWTSNFPRWTPIEYRNVVDSFVAGGGVVACWLSGHRHSDICGTWNSILSITVTTAGNTGVTRSYDDRSDNTKNQDAFNIIAIDTEYQIVKMMRIGQTYSVGL